MFVPVSYSYAYKNQACAYNTVLYEFIMENKHAVLGSKTKLWGSGVPVATFMLQST